ncbi:MAG: carbohydrate ABC transporter substrate-binding protein [Clostridia bacterium]|jgi:ABC-type glycerol-3-phosphate transport system substrate-binding protein|nr:carbohydrate ABC transporter substrate-binding protein [Clostridia bacterium]MBQ3893747.1 carbohydrate ABC transporter substrate-binding protein [Clostridia bacterium]
MRRNISFFVRGFFAVLAAAVFLTLFACVPSEKVKGELPEGYIPEVKGRLKVGVRQNVFPTESSRKSINNWLNWFRIKHPDVTIEANYTVPDDYAALISSRTIGDVYWLSDETLNYYALTHEALMPLDSYIEAFEIDLSQLYSGILALCETAGKYYFVGATCGNITLTYNMDAMIEAGILSPGERVADDWTWEDFKDYAERLKKYDVDGKTLTQVGGSWPLDWSNTFSPFIYAYGGMWADKINKKVMLSNDLVRKGIGEVISALDNRWLFPTGIRMSKEMASSYGSIQMHSGPVFVSNNAYTVLTYSGDFYNQTGTAWDVAPWPLFPEKASPCGTLGFGVFSYTKNSDAAAALVLSLWTEEGQLAFHSQEGGDVPVIKKLGEQDFWHLTREGYDHVNFGAFTANYDRYVAGQVTATVPPDIATLMKAGIKDLFESYCLGESSWEDKLEKLEAQCNDLWETLYD